MIRNLLAAIGLLALFAGAVLLVQVNHLYQNIQAFDPKAIDTYGQYADTLLTSGSAVEAAVWKFRVREGMTAAAVAEALQRNATEHGLDNLGEIALSAHIESRVDTAQPLAHTYLYCDPVTLGKLVAHNPAWIALPPCGISLVEDTAGQLWLITRNPDLPIHGGLALPEWLLPEVTRARDALFDTLQTVAAGQLKPDARSTLTN